MTNSLPLSASVAGLLFFASATSMAASTPPDQTCIYIPKQPADFDELSENSMREWWPSLAYAINPQHLSIENHLGPISTIRQRFVPSDKGSDRVVLNLPLEPGETYELNQSILFEPGFDWGGESEGGKIGFGFGGGSLPSGGDLNKDGFTVRLIWNGNHDGSAALGAYVYSANRSQNLPFGDEYIIDGFQIPTNTWIDTTLVITMNTSTDLANGSLAIWVGNEVKLWRENIQWQSEGDVIKVDTLLYSSFYGGNSSAWAPDHTTHARVSNICYNRY